MSEELKPCPFCGEVPDLPSGDGTQYEIECGACGGAMVSVQISTLMTHEERSSDPFTDYRYAEQFIQRAKTEAIELWNTRATPPAAQVQGEQPMECSCPKIGEQWDPVKHGKDCPVHEPGVAQLQGELGDFEAWVRQRCGMPRHVPVNWEAPFTLDTWAAWNARAALSAPPAADMADAYVGSREDVAIWKRRALEAEQKVRVLDQRIDQLVLDAQGETRMGEPYIAPPAAGVLEQMSEEARSTLVGMVEYCLNARVCMGMDEGFKSFEPEVEHDFVKELRAFAEGAPTPPAAGVPETVHVLRKAYEGNSAGLFNSGAPKHLWSAAMLELFESLDEEVQEEARETVMAHSDMRAVAAIDSVIALLAATTPPASEQQQAVVMPERKEIPDQATFPGGPAYYAKEFDKARAHNACLDELLRLNPRLQPAAPSQGESE
ncbi:Lar family restriction alleviation protein [Pseudomonas tohonis]|uniref:Lar family restriction alleviation protein n=1 Tax=Pseudomonas tohonis TaxID=2725477 RepID=UPI0015665D84|nr:Lar family restriction alleviation protein [Pseudomonas tohonis]